jgi:hypothetical protein
MKRLKKGFPEFLSVIEYTVSFAKGVELQKVVMFNETVVSEVEVRSWIKQGLLGFEDKPTVVVMTKQQYENLFDHVSVDNSSEEFYDDLRVEQQGGIC